jgi:splicing factor U2AF subunit
MSIHGGAEHLARIHGTEEDKVNCPFYYKIGACLHGDKCSRVHYRPQFSQTIIILHMWTNPLCVLKAAGHDIKNVDHKQLQLEFDDFYCEIFEEFSKFGKIEDIQVCENFGEHMVGNVYVKYEDEEDAEAAKNATNGRYYAKKLLQVEYSPVTDFREARCRQFDEGVCSRDGFCNFMHAKSISNELRKHLDDTYGFRGGGKMSHRRDRRDDRDNRQRYDGRDNRRRSRSRDRRRDERRSRSRDRRRDERRSRSRDRRRSRSRDRRRDESDSSDDESAKKEVKE